MSWKIFNGFCRKNRDFATATTEECAMKDKCTMNGQRARDVKCGGGVMFERFDGFVGTGRSGGTGGTGAKRTGAGPRAPLGQLGLLGQLGRWAAVAAVAAGAWLESARDAEIAA